MAIAHRFRHAITISRWTLGATTDPRGRRNDSWVDDGSAIAGNVQRRASREVPTGEAGTVAISNAIGFLPIGTVVNDRDRLKVGASTYAIVGPPRDAGGRGRHLELDLRVVVP